MMMMMMMMMEPITYSTAGQQTDSGATIVYSAKEGMLLPLRRRHCSLIALLLLIATENHCRLRSGNVCGPLSPPETGGSACGAVIQSPGIPLSVRPPHRTLEARARAFRQLSAAVASAGKRSIDHRLYRNVAVRPSVNRWCIRLFDARSCHPGDMYQQSNFTVHQSFPKSTLAETIWMSKEKTF